jgi:hypothetical protein
VQKNRGKKEENKEKGGKKIRKTKEENENREEEEDFFLKGGNYFKVFFLNPPRPILGANLGFIYMKTQNKSSLSSAWWMLGHVNPMQIFFQRFSYVGKPTIYRFHFLNWLHSRMSLHGMHY